MEDTLYYSTICRLCAEENPNGTILFGNNSEEPDLSILINKYLPLKVSDDGKLPRTICPGCNIQLEATVEFLDLVIGGQSLLRDLLQSQIGKQKKSEKEQEEEEILVQIFEDGSLYAPDHTVTLRVKGLEKPKRRRGRPSKKPKPPSPVPEELPEVQPAEESINDSLVVDGRKRQRKTPKRFTETVQGKELERIFREEGVIDENESDSAILDGHESLLDFAVKKEELWTDQVIGHMENSDGTPAGELIINKSKGRGRPKGRPRPECKTCTICSTEFPSVLRYLAHMAEVHKNKTEINANANAKEESIAHAHAAPAETESLNNLLNKELIFNEQTSLLLSSHVNQTDNNVFQDLEKAFMKPTNLISIPETPESTSEAGKPSVKEPITLAVKLENSSKFKCPQCDKVFHSKQSCEVHTKVSHLGHRPFKCKHCPKTFPYQVSLKQHMLVHNVQRGYACDICDKVLNHPSSVIYHKEAEHNNGRRFVCNKCSRSFKHRQLLQRHQIVHSENRPYVCKTCNATFKTKANLMNHQPTHTGVKKFSCAICNQQFAHKASLTLHIRWHSGKKPYQCSVCSKSFSQNGNLAEHMRIHTGEKPYTCTICQRSFTTSSQHRLHLQRHSGERPWQCQDCGKKFLYKETWRCHTRRHRGERPYECPQCGRGFIERWALRKHLRLHSGERPYVCNICGRSFADCSNLAKHKKIHREPIKLNSILEPPVEESVGSAVDNIISDSLESQVVYVTYTPGEDEEGSPTFTIINEGQKNLEELNQLYDTEGDILIGDNTVSITAVDGSQPENEDMTNAIFDQQVIDQDGNPLHFTLQDGTQVAITTTDGGKSLQVTTENGETIPVQITDGVNDNLLKENMAFDTSAIAETDANQELMQSIRVMSVGGQTVRVVTALDENNYSHYYTFA